MTMQQKQANFRLSGHIVSILCGAFLGGIGFAYASTLGQAITQTEFFYLMMFETVNACACVAWYAVSLRFSPAGVDLNTTPPPKPGQGTGQN